MLPLLKIAIIAAIVSAATVGVTIGIVYAVAPIESTEPCSGIKEPETFTVSLHSDNAFLTWSRAIVPSNCAVNFEISAYLNDEFLRNATVYGNQYIFPIDFNPSCSVFTFKLRAISEGRFHSDAVIREIYTDIDEIQGLVFENDLVRWTTNNQYTKCTFEIKLNDELVEITSDHNWYDVSRLPLCRMHQFSITPIHFNGDRGSYQVIAFERDFQPINELELIVTDENVVRVDLNLNENINECKELRRFHFDFDCNIDINTLKNKRNRVFKRSVKIISAFDSDGEEVSGEAIITTTLSSSTETESSSDTSSSETTPISSTDTSSTYSTSTSTETESSSDTSSSETTPISSTDTSSTYTTSTSTETESSSDTSSSETTSSTSDSEDTVTSTESTTPSTINTQSTTEITSTPTSTETTIDSTSSEITSETQSSPTPTSTEITETSPETTTGLTVPETTTSPPDIVEYHYFERCPVEEVGSVFTMSINPIITAGKEVTTVDIVCGYDVDTDDDGRPRLSLLEDFDSICPKQAKNRE